jgi:hypothetical protein
MTLPCVCELTDGGQKPPPGLRQLFELTNKAHAGSGFERAHPQGGSRTSTISGGAAAGGMAVLPAAPVSFSRSRRQIQPANPTYKDL